MRRILLATTCSFAMSCSALANNLTVTVDGIDTASGTLFAQLMDSEAAWNGKAKPVGGARQVISSTDAVELRFENLPAGRYALRLMHDENDNGKLDTNFLGMPEEAYGYSNNPDVMRAAEFEEAAFEIGDGDTRIAVELR
ncbi:DUF2141 domain-containing protein [Pseudomarimonas arenosa]|uniref:DUF2141 domain-containing protein n=1 Tax=Pseudomarimonas arenosa TaxID=2774145 RepID=A0AAW3ZN95_9GAMM|nr:DUF2141 domain-containing protein [Pseudomarimonas arenosa]MBD8525771.1 DUF2141 domain-containing protein [Pseudomarimonas arenosa]